MTLSIKEIIRDAAFIFLINYFVGFLTGYIGGNSLTADMYMNVLVVTGYFATLIAFCFIISWTKNNRAAHSLSVGVLLWVLGASETLPLGNWSGWFISGIWVLGIVLLALGIIGLVEKPLKEKPWKK